MGTKCTQSFVIGDFNHWQNDHELCKVGQFGIWEGFVPGLTAGDLYKYEFSATTITVLKNVILLETCENHPKQLGCRS